MKNNFECLKNREIYDILDGDTPIINYRDVEYKMPYYTSSELVGICKLFGCQNIESRNSRWTYVELLMEKAINDHQGNEILRYFFSKERFSKTLKSNTPEEVDIVYKKIVDEAIKKINAILWFENCELKVVNEHFYVTEIGKESDINTPTIDKYSLEYVHGLFARCKEDFISENYDSVITKSRTMMEEILIYILEQRGKTVESKGDLSKIYNQVKIELNMQQNKSYDGRVNSMLGGLEKILQAIAEMRNNNSDAHGVGQKRIKIKMEEARLAMNSSVIFCEYVLSVYDNASQKKTLEKSL